MRETSPYREIDHLDVGRLQEADYDLTRAIARLCFDWGAAGIVYGSRIDNEDCAALFEGRAYLKPVGAPMALTDSLPELQQVCREFRLDLPPSAP